MYHDLLEIYGNDFGPPKTTGAWFVRRTFYFGQLYTAVQSHKNTVIVAPWNTSLLTFFNSCIPCCTNTLAAQRQNWCMHIDRPCSWKLQNQGGCKLLLNKQGTPMHLIILACYLRKQVGFLGHRPSKPGFYRYYRVWTHASPSFPLGLGLFGWQRRWGGVTWRKGVK